MLDYHVFTQVAGDKLKRYLIFKEIEFDLLPSEDLHASFFAKGEVPTIVVYGRNRYLLCRSEDDRPAYPPQVIRLE